MNADADADAMQRHVQEQPHILPYARRRRARGSFITERRWRTSEPALEDHGGGHLDVAGAGRERLDGLLPRGADALQRLDGLLGEAGSCAGGRRGRGARGHLLLRLWLTLRRLGGSGRGS